jgi:hypothetical protein
VHQRLRTQADTFQLRHVLVHALPLPLALARLDAAPIRLEAMELEPHRRSQLQQTRRASRCSRGETHGQNTFPLARGLIARVHRHYVAAPRRSGVLGLQPESHGQDAIRRTLRQRQFDLLRLAAGHRHRGAGFQFTARGQEQLGGHNGLVFAAGGIAHLQNHANRIRTVPSEKPPLHGYPGLDSLEHRHIAAGSNLTEHQPSRRYRSHPTD